MPRLAAKELTKYEQSLRDILSKPCPKDEKKRNSELAKSPLAAPYFISPLLQDNDLEYGDVELGKALYEALQQVADSLWIDGPPQNYDAMKTALESILNDKEHDHFHAVHLELRFFQKFLHPDSIAAIGNKFLHMGVASEFGHFNGTIRKVGQKLAALLGSFSKSVSPRLDDIVGAGRNLIQLQEWLYSGQTVNLSGQGGVGKSTLAVLTAYAWPQAPFLHTVWPNLNDELDRLLFELGHALHVLENFQNEKQADRKRRLGCSKLWKLILSEGGLKDSNRIQDALYGDLAACHEEKVLAMDDLAFSKNANLNRIELQRGEFLKFLEDIRDQVQKLTIYAWPKTSFLYTIRPNINDRLSSFLFELGQFLHRLGHANLWKLVLAEGGNVQDSNIALAILAEDLRACQLERPLLIIDEVDRLHSPNPDLAKSQHVEFLEFLEAIRGQVPLLLVGQRAVLEGENNLELLGLAPFQIKELLRQSAIFPLPSDEDINRLHKATQGNPRLLLLCIALYRNENLEEQKGTFNDIITTVSLAPGFGPLLNRLWERLSTDQRELLQRLSVYPDSAPQMYWPVKRDDDLQESANRLLELRLVEERGQESVGLLPALRDRIYSEKIMPDSRETYHFDAAIILEKMAQYTDAAYHLVKGGQPAQAIQLWYPVIDEEIQRGQAGKAYALFINLAHRNLGKDERKALREIQARLHEIYGEIEEGLNTISLEEWSESSEQQARILALQGKFENALGLRFSHAEKSYKRSLDTITRLIAQNITTYRGYGFVHIHEGKLDDAEMTADAAEQELLILRGSIAFQRSQWQEALEYFEKSLMLAEELKNPAKVAISHQELSAVYTRLGQFEKAIWHSEEAKLSYDEMGDRFKSAKVDHILTATYFDIGNYQKSIEVGERTARFFEDIKNPYLAAATGATVAEAYFKLGYYEQAELMANRVLWHEDPHATPYAYFTLGLLSEAKGDFQMAMLNFQRSLDIAESNEDPFIEPYARRAYGKMLCECEIDKADKGIEQLRRALAQFEQIKQEQEVEATQKILDSVTS